MYIYKFEYAYFDEYYCFELKHKEKYSKDDLKKIQETILNQILEEQKETNKKIKYSNEALGDWLYSESDIAERIREILIQQYNFKECYYNSYLYTSMDDWYKKYIMLDKKNTMRHATKEEQECINKAIEKMSEDTGVNLNDYIGSEK